MNRICNICNNEINENDYLKDRTVCKCCYNKNRRKNNNKQPKIEQVNNNKNNDINVSVPAYEKYACVVIGLRDVGKTYNMLKILEKIGNKRPIYIITRSLNQYPNYKTSKETKPINKDNGSVVIFDDMLGARNSFQIDEFFTRGRHEALDVYYITQSYFALPRQSIRNNSD